MEGQRLIGITLSFKDDTRLKDCPEYIILCTCVINLQGSHNGIDVNWAVSCVTIEGQAEMDGGQE
jgi:hypothetical protein